MSLLSAHEARETSQRIQNGKRVSQMKQLAETIAIAVSLGRDEVLFYQALIPENRAELEAAHYKIEECRHQNEATVTISWK